MVAVPKVKARINLNELFQTDVRFSQGTKERLGQAIIDQIVTRTSELRRDRFDNVMKGYSASYAKSLDGQIFGKVRGQPANLLATGDMLGSMNIIEETRDTITVGFDDPRENAKAYGHISGMRGHPTVKNGKVRDFLGLSPKDIEALRRDWADDIELIEQVERTTSREELDQATIDVIAQLEGELDDGS